MSSPNVRLRAAREERGLSQEQLGRRAGVSRQAVGAIEAGRATPSVDVALAVARALGTTVETLFGAEGEPARVVRATPVGAGGPRVVLARSGTRWFAHPLRAGNVVTPADGVMGPVRAGRVEVAVHQGVAAAAETVVVMGCAPALGVLAGLVNGLGRGPRLVWIPSSTAAALEALSAGQVHVAAVHGLSGRGPARASRVGLGRWELGLVTAPGASRRLSRLEDLALPGIRVVAREPGAGARQLAEAALARRRPTDPRPLIALGHLEVAHAVALGAAEAGVATRDAALAYQLDFVPVREEAVELFVPSGLMRDSRLQLILDVMTGVAFRGELVALGYDVATLGDIATAQAPQSGPAGTPRR